MTKTATLTPSAFVVTAWHKDGTEDLNAVAVVLDTKSAAAYAQELLSTGSYSEVKVLEFVDEELLEGENPQLLSTVVYTNS